MVSVAATPGGAEDQDDGAEEIGMAFPPNPRTGYEEEASETDA